MSFVPAHGTSDRPSAVSQPRDDHGRERVVWRSASGARGQIDGVELPRLNAITERRWAGNGRRDYAVCLRRSAARAAHRGPDYRAHPGPLRRDDSWPDERAGERRVGRVDVRINSSCRCANTLRGTVAPQVRRQRAWCRGSGRLPWTGRPLLAVLPGEFDVRVLPPPTRHRTLRPVNGRRRAGRSRDMRRPHRRSPHFRRGGRG